MSTNKPNNPPAFPVMVAEGDFNEGMTLRDYFANDAEVFDESFTAKWIAECLGIPDPTNQISSTDKQKWFLWWKMAEAKWKFAFADAMLAEREQGL